MGKGHARRLSCAWRSLHGAGRPRGVRMEGVGSAVGSRLGSMAAHLCLLEVRSGHKTDTGETRPPGAHT